ASPRRGRSLDAARAKRLVDPVDTRLNGVVEMLVAEQRPDSLPNDVVRLEIGEGAADPLPRLDSNLAIRRRNHEEDPVVLSLLANLPRVEGVVGDVFDRLAVERRNDQDGDLVARLLANPFELALEVLRLGGRELAREIVDVASKRGRRERERRRRTEH